jgi:putative hydrolase of the HAD superfamily
MIEVLDERQPGHGIGLEDVRPFLRNGFPWHAPEVAHPELATVDAWWGHVEPLLVRGYEGVGVAAESARIFSRFARERYIDVQYWQLFDDTVPALTDLREHGWRHVILSNHVPELGSIVTDLGLGALVDATVNSAETGYEKPHPEAFAHARRVAGNPTVIWMVGDNPDADVAGAEAVGIPAVLVRRDSQHSAVRRRSATLAGVGRLVRAQE